MEGIVLIRIRIFLGVICSFVECSRNLMLFEFIIYNFGSECVYLHDNYSPDESRYLLVPTKNVTKRKEISH